MIKNKFILGEEWLYYKIYCGLKTTDLLLTETLKPLADDLLANNLIDQWFFIRYKDTDNHLRIRFHFVNLDHLGTVISKIKTALTPFIDNHSIYKIQTDTYHRELSRYGKNTIALAETLFYHDSVCITSALRLIENEDLLLLFILKSTDDLLHNFGLDTTQKLAFTSQQMAYYKTEFHANKQTNKQLSKKFADRKPALFEFLDNLENSSEYQELFILLKQKSELDKKIIVTFENKTDLLSSLIHMSINRCFSAKQRLYELLCYDFLVKYYKTSLAKEKYKL